MRKFSTKLIFLLLVSSFLLPFFPVIAQPTPAQVPSFIIGTTGGQMGHWDSVAASAGFAGTDYASQCLESLWVWPEDWSGDYEEAIPVLAESWVITKWPSEMNYHPTNPFVNGDGIRAIEFTLRSGVKFHDGSDFNATVAKWNIDRMMVQSGNITGGLTALSVAESDWYKSRTSYWLPAEKWAPFETDTWNVSQFSDDFASYAEYGSNYDWWSYGHYPRIRNVTITEDLASGGKIKVYFNDWTGILAYINNVMISMDAYKDYFDEPILGPSAPGIPQPDITGGYPTTGFRGHMIGTGPYRFIDHDEIVIQGGTMEKFDDWWNATAMEARGLFQAPALDVATFGYDTAGIAGRNLAMATYTIDIAFDSVGAGGLNYIDMIADPNINYVLTGTEPTRTYISLNCVNETYWKDWADMSPINLTEVFGPYEAWVPWTMPDVGWDGTVNTDGIDRAMRKAVSYAFDYDTFINVILGGRAIRSGGFLPTTNVHYNPAISLPYHNLTIARQTLIDDPVWGLVVAARNLDINNDTADWLDVAATNPIFTFNLAWDQANLDISNVFATSINSIGMRCGGPFGAPDPAWEVVPDFYTALYSDYSFNALTYHGIPTNWPGFEIRATPSLEYYYHSPGLPYVNGSGAVYPFEQFYNINFVYNETVDKLLDETWFSNFSRTQEIMDELTTHFQTRQFSDIMVAEPMSGYAIHKDWEFPESGATTYAFLKYLPEQEGEPGVQIPGYQTAAILAIAVVTITGIGYSLNRKRKLA
ncbi:MAG: ABC transporter substrate-binding protein [Promethearchaeota archaeon]|jgi:ABC-type transport system substrate-binding protein